MNGRTKSSVAAGRILMLAFVMSSTVACATQTVPIRRDMGMGPALSVESFLQAANSEDFYQMASLFGTADGPIADTGSPLGCMFKKMGSWIGLGDSCINYQEVELRMHAIASMLKHDDYRLGGDQRVAGRENPTTQIPVNLTRGRDEFAGVPFTVVQAGNGGWLIEEIGLEVMTGNGW